MNSNDLMATQEIIESLTCELIKEPMKNWALIKQYQSVLKDIDSRRRKMWHDEKFGAYEEIASNVLDVNFSMDDIPF